MNDVSYSDNAPRMLVVATLDRSLRPIFPHMDACRAAGWRVDAACNITDFEDEISKHCDRLIEVPFRRSPIHPMNIVTLMNLVGVIKRNRYDIIHTHTPAGGMVGRAAATLAGTPIRMYMAHGFHFHPEGSKAGNAIFSSLERFASYRLSDWVQVINDDDYRNATAFNVVPREKLVLIDGLGIRTQCFDPASYSAEQRLALRSELQISVHDPVIGVVGELSKRKRVCDTIEAVSILKKRYPNVRLILLGYGSEQASLEAQAASLGVKDNVRFLGFQRDVPKFVSIMDAFAFSTQQEGLPLCLMEAMCMGVPSVATNIRGNRDLIVDGKNGLLVPLGDTSAMAAACDRIFSDQEFAASIAAAGRKLITDKYDLEVTIAQFMNSYREAFTLAKQQGRLRKNILVHFTRQTN